MPGDASSSGMQSRTEPWKYVTRVHRLVQVRVVTAQRQMGAVIGRQGATIKWVNGSSF
jgi:hypothetical protein